MLPVSIGSTALGQRVGGAQSVDELCRTVEGWKSWSFEERDRVQSSEEFVLPVLLDREGRGSHDWLLAIVTSGETGVKFGWERFLARPCYGSLLSAGSCSVRCAEVTRSDRRREKSGSR